MKFLPHTTKKLHISFIAKQWMKSIYPQIQTCWFVNVFSSNPLISQVSYSRSTRLRHPQSIIAPSQGLMKPKSHVHAPKQSQKDNTDGSWGVRNFDEKKFLRSKNYFLFFDRESIQETLKSVQESGKCPEALLRHSKGPRSV